MRRRNRFAVCVEPNGLDAMACAEDQLLVRIGLPARCAQRERRQQKRDDQERVQTCAGSADHAQNVCPSWEKGKGAARFVARFTQTGLLEEAERLSVRRFLRSRLRRTQGTELLQAEAEARQGRNSRYVRSGASRISRAKMLHLQHAGTKKGPSHPRSGLTFLRLFADQAAACALAMSFLILSAFGDRSASFALARNASRPPL